MKTIKLIFVTILPFVSACTSTLEKEFLHLCKEEHHGKAIGLVGAEGYSFETNKDSFYWFRALLDTNYQYLEFCVNEGNLNEAATIPGCWRVSKIEKSKSCNQAITKEYRNWKSYKTFFDEQCIKSGKIEKLEARYHFISIEEDYLAKGVREKITKHSQIIIDTNKNAVINNDIRYLRYVYNPMAGVLANSTCPNTNPNWDWFWLLNKTLTPSKT